MIIFNDIETIEHFSQTELQQHILITISNITEGAIYNPDIYGRFAVVEPGDSIAAIEDLTGCQVIHDQLNNSLFSDAEIKPSFEWLVEHPSFYEAVFILSDDGYGIDLLIPKAPGINPQLLAMCAKYAVPA